MPRRRVLTCRVSIDGRYLERSRLRLVQHRRESSNHNMASPKDAEAKANACASRLDRPGPSPAGEGACGCPRFQQFPRKSPEGSNEPFSGVHVDHRIRPSRSKQRVLTCQMEIATVAYIPRMDPVLGPLGASTDPGPLHDSRSNSDVGEVARTAGRHCEHGCSRTWNAHDTRGPPLSPCS